MGKLALQPVDAVQVTVLVDNMTDLLLADNDTVKRLRTMPPQVPLAEHGLAYLISVEAGGNRHTLLMDAGVSGTCLLHNDRLLPASLAWAGGLVTHRLADVRAVVLSHGHFDHFGGLAAFLDTVDEPMPLVVHPEAFHPRRKRLGDDRHLEMPALDKEELEAAGAVVDLHADACTVAGGCVLVSGQVERQTPFEKGAPDLEIQIAGRWATDPFHDDQSLAIHLKGKGLLVIGGCCHAGIINTIEQLRRLSGIETVHAVMGGFHLGGAPADVVQQTVAAMESIAPAMIVPMHCTGWAAMKAFAAAMPQQFVLNSVGTTYLFRGQ